MPGTTPGSNAAARAGPGLPLGTAGEICSREVVIAGRDTAAGEAARLMRQYHVGSLVVVEPGPGGARVPVGIVTDRDLVVAVMAADLPPSAITVGEVMTPPLATAREGEGLLDVLRLMREHGVRRIPVVGAQGELIGIAALDDLVEILAESLGDLARIVARERSREAATRP